MVSGKFEIKINEYWSICLCIISLWRPYVFREGFEIRFFYDVKIEEIDLWKLFRNLVLKTIITNTKNINNKKILNLSLAFLFLKTLLMFKNWYMFLWPRLFWKTRNSKRLMTVGITNKVNNKLPKRYNVIFFFISFSSN
jgi:hypothetical protein